ncbi:hypothetical protein ACP70R_036135 [Stipagrostis hirtigluma subsp. patula]
MPSSRAGVVIAVATVVVLLLGVAVAGQTAVVDPDGGGRAWAAADHGAVCKGAVEECVAGGEAAAAGTRRELGRGGYISYDAMRRGQVPCNIRGASYYNCRPGAPANPYSRGCSAITRCRGG